jgi:hypothetical protein
LPDGTSENFSAGGLDRFSRVTTDLPDVGQISIFLDKDWTTSISLIRFNNFAACAHAFGAAGRVNPTGSRLEQASINAGLGALDRHGADRFRIEGGWPHSADDGVAEALSLHVFKASEQQGFTDSAISRAGFYAGGPEEIGTGGVVAGKSQDVFFLDHDETGNKRVGG